jgi:glycosyltransferase involved in cell wall biosynthesis
MDLLTPPKRQRIQHRKKVVVLCDHPLYPSGVGTQANFLIQGLVETGKWKFVCLGAAIKHQDMRTIQVNENYIIKPVVGFGTKEDVRKILYTEKPDVVLIFTDPRQFLWLWEMEDEIRQVCPIAYWHVWDNDPAPIFNKVWYRSTDQINCISKLTYDLVTEVIPSEKDRVCYIPHAFPDSYLKPYEPGQVKQYRQKMLGGRALFPTYLWVNRNATRKMPNDVLNAWSMFVSRLNKEKGYMDVNLVMHTQPHDPEGPNLFETVKMLKLDKTNTVKFSINHVSPEEMKMIHESTDCTVNISKAEGFGLPTLISAMAGKPSIVNFTGGLKDQAVNKNGDEVAIIVRPSARTMVGSQIVPFIYDDHVDVNDVADAMMKMYELGAKGRSELGQKAREHAQEAFNFTQMISDWDRTLELSVIRHKARTGSWELIELDGLEAETLPPMMNDRRQVAG